MSGAVHAVAFAHNGQRLFTAGADGTVRAFDPNSGKEVWKQQAHDGQALALATEALRQVVDQTVDGSARQPDGKPDLDQHGQAESDEDGAQQAAAQQ